MAADLLWIITVQGAVMEGNKFKNSTNSILYVHKAN
jgi:hypothetical protein